MTIAARLDELGVPCPSASERRRNQHRAGRAWSATSSLATVRHPGTGVAMPMANIARSNGFTTAATPQRGSCPSSYPPTSRPGSWSKAPSPPSSPAKTGKPRRPKKRPPPPAEADRTPLPGTPCAAWSCVPCAATSCKAPHENAPTANSTTTTAVSTVGLPRRRRTPPLALRGGVSGTPLTRHVARSPVRPGPHRRDHRHVA